VRLIRGRNNKASAQQRLIKIMPVAALLFLLLFATQLNFFHQLLHQSNEQVLHSEEHEENFCHRSIYHGDDNGCGHKAHLVELDNCELCLVHLSFDFYFNLFLEYKLILIKEAIITFLENSSTNFFLFLFSSRAPPLT
jgi:hypothetical protein